LKNKYKLYLSTGSSTKFANEILELWWIKQYFEQIQWSEIIPKSEEHLDIFEKYSEDKDFFKKAISIGDSLRDELFAKKRNIDFIKIWEKYKSISEIENI
jgi:phosphoglycolate phosphatase-like HAD superfamily hydrolase